MPVYMMRLYGAFFQVRSRFTGDQVFEVITEEVERVRLFKEFVKGLKVCVYVGICCLHECPIEGGFMIMTTLTYDLCYYSDGQRSSSLRIKCYGLPLVFFCVHVHVQNHVIWAVE